MLWKATIKRWETFSEIKNMITEMFEITRIGKEGEAVSESIMKAQINEGMREIETQRISPGVLTTSPTSTGVPKKEKIKRRWLSNKNMRCFPSSDGSCSSDLKISLSNQHNKGKGQSKRHLDTSLWNFIKTKIRRISKDRSTYKRNRTQQIFRGSVT